MKGRTALKHMKFPYRYGTFGSLGTVTNATIQQDNFMSEVSLWWNALSKDVRTTMAKYIRRSTDTPWEADLQTAAYLFFHESIR